MAAKSQFLFFCLATGTVAAWTTPASAVQVFTYQGGGLDAEATEISAGAGGAVTYGLNGTKVNMNGRYNGYNNGVAAGVPEAEGGDADNDDRNEFWVMRFDLSGMDKSQIANVRVRVTPDRDTNNDKDLRIWGVNSGVEGLNTFAESGTFGDVPGLVEDGDMTTQGVDQSLTTFLGDFRYAETTPGVYPLEGDLVDVNQTQIDNFGPNQNSEHGGGGVAVQNTLQGFLRSLSTDDMAVFLIGGFASNGQVRITTKEATQTSGGVFSCPSGECAPILQFDLVAGVPGDYNGNDVVDAADYTAWRDRLGQTFTLPNENPADSNPGVVDIDDYTYWVSQFGNSAGGASVAALAVPEPSMLTIIGMTMIVGAVVSSRRR
jgi:hypothetical protein